MTTTTLSPTGSQGSSLRRTAAILLIVEALIIFAPLFILGAAINWPASLDEPASVNLPLILEQYPAMMTGYSIYLVYSLLFWPVAYVTGRVIVGEDVQNPLFRVANGFAIISALARTLGIVRWLFGMPVLARLYVDGSPQTQEMVSLIYETMNAYGGGVGEILGVGLFAAIWVGLMGVLLLRSAEWPTWLGIWSMVAAAGLLLNLGGAVGIDLGPIATINVTVFHFWMLALAVFLLRRKAR